MRTQAGLFFVCVLVMIQCRLSRSCIDIRSTLATLLCPSKDSKFMISFIYLNSLLRAVSRPSPGRHISTICASATIWRRVLIRTPPPPWVLIPVSSWLAGSQTQRTNSNVFLIFRARYSYDTHASRMLSLKFSAAVFTERQKV